MTDAGAPAGRAAVLGSPIGHSLSPVLHRAAYAALGLRWSYQAVDCDVARLPETLRRLARTHVGVSLTMPLKRAVLPLLAGLAGAAATVEAVNTVLFHPGGWRGHNTDVAGVTAALAELGATRPRRPLLLGGGGTARAALAALVAAGASQVTVCVRNPRQGAEMAELGARLDVLVDPAGWAAAADRVPRADLVVAAVPATATDRLAGQLAGRWPAGTALFDVVYAPWPTRLASAAGAAPVVGGLPMLVAQAAEQVRLMTGHPAPASAMRAAAERALRQR